MITWRKIAFILLLVGISFISFSLLYTRKEKKVEYKGPVRFVDPTTVASNGNGFTSLLIGPDDKLWGLASDGIIKSWYIDHQTGLLSNEQVYTSLQDAEGGKRLAIGLAFDPESTADSLVLWVSHSIYGFDEQPNFQGKVSRIAGPELEQVQDYLIHLPRSKRDHATNGLSFGPDSALYILQGSNTAMGSYDDYWRRNEALLSSALLRLDLDLIEQKQIALPIDARTEEGGSYNPYAADAPLTLYATGIRNAFDMVWHSNGQLYVPTNGSVGSANAPGSHPDSEHYVAPQYRSYAGPEVPHISVSEIQNDYLFRIEKGGYYGHPNPRRAQYVLNGGNPLKSRWPEAVVEQYPEGTMPDADYRGYAASLGRNKSANGVIEYRSSAFQGALTGKMINVWFGPSTLVILDPGKDPAHDFVKVIEGVPGFGGFNKPLDVVEDTVNGNLYISEYQATTEGGTGKITLLKPAVPPVSHSVAGERSEKPAS